MTHPLSVAVNTPPGPGEYFLSAGRFSAQTGCEGSVWRRAACSIFLRPPPLSPQTSPTCRGKRRKRRRKRSAAFKYMCHETDISPGLSYDTPHKYKHVSTTVCVYTLHTLSTLILHPPVAVCPFQ